MAIYLITADLLLAVSFLIVYAWPDSCKFQAGCSQFFPLASVLWTYCIAWTLLQNLVKMRRMDEIAKYEIPMVSFCLFLQRQFTLILSNLLLEKNSLLFHGVFR